MAPKDATAATTDPWHVDNSDHPTDLPDHVDVLVVGAGLSGIGFGVRMTMECPTKSFVIVEARAASGGTWDLFRYPGVRSDSDMFTLGYPYRPWDGEKSIADGPDILTYVRETAAAYGIDQKIRYRCKVVDSSWDSAKALWSVDIEQTDAATGATQLHTITTNFLHLCSGYYRYESTYQPTFEGREDFAGTIVHPQFWPEDLDYTGKRVVIIGSGATAVTLLPAMADQAAHVTMLQRSPSYVISQPGTDPIANFLRKRLPAKTAATIIRGKNIASTSGFYQLTRRRPKMAKALLRAGLKHAKLDEQTIAEHFTPRYDPWDQRLCAVPSGDLFEALHGGKASIVTHTIDRFVPDGIKLTNGEVVPADIIVTATGLDLLPLGGMSIKIDGEPISMKDTFAYRGYLLDGVPNAALTVGYINASWTLRADLVARSVCRLLNYMDTQGYAVATPRAPKGMTARPLLDLPAGYVLRAMDRMPKQGDRDPWRIRQNYMVEARTLPKADLAEDMQFERAPRAAVAR